MGGFFDPNGKLMRWGMKLANLMGLQLLTLLCALPVVTAGAAFSAMHKLLLQIYRDEDGGIVKPFFQAFAENFRQATVIWLGYLVMLFALYVNYRITQTDTASWASAALRYAVPVALVILAASLVWVFVFQSRYRNTVLGTMKLSFVACIAHPLYTVCMMALMALPAAALLLSWRTLPFVVLLGFTLPGFLRARLYSRVFDDLEGVHWREEREKEQQNGI